MGGRILLTGFEPFEGRRMNASWAAVEEVARRWTAPTELVVIQLPVSFRRARQVLRSAVAEHRPRVVVCVGEAGDRRDVGIERVARNLIAADRPDNDGSAPAGVPVISRGPEVLTSTLPLETCLTAVDGTGVPATISGTAGTYVCNATFYALMHLLTAARPTVRGGFVHVPRTPAQVGPGDAAMSTTDAAAALGAILLAAASE